VNGPEHTWLLEARDIEMRFGGVTALKGVSFRVPANAIVSLIGPNGAGKTTLFNVMTGEYRPTGGEVVFDGTCVARAVGRRVSGLSPDRVTALGIGRTFQNIRVFRNMSALENVLVGMHCRLRYHHWWEAAVRTPRFISEEREAAERALDLLTYVGLAGRAEDWAGSLPYGEQRRLEIARALATDPKLLLLDEPTAGMNPAETDEMTAFISRIREERGVSILLIEHDMRVVMRISERVTVLDFGEVIAEGPPDQIRRDPKVVRAYLGTAGGQ
jgi:branched-chain amino acid transport system ATP-binding protein